MEALDDFMAQKGWRPKVDTLAKIANLTHGSKIGFSQTRLISNRVNGFCCTRMDCCTKAV